MNYNGPRRLAILAVTALAPLIMALSVFIANEAQALFGMNLTGDSLAAYISAFLITVGAVLFRLLEHEAARFIHHMAQLLLNPPQPTAVVPPPAAETPAPAEPGGQA